MKNVGQEQPDDENDEHYADENVDGTPAAQATFGHQRGFRMQISRGRDGGGGALEQRAGYRGGAERLLRSLHYGCRADGMSPNLLPGWHPLRKLVLSADGSVARRWPRSIPSSQA